MTRLNLRRGIVAVSVLTAGVPIVHEGRYLLGFGADAGTVSAQQGHAYLAYVMPFIAFVVAVGFATVLASFLFPAGGPRLLDRRSRVGVAWLACSAFLAAAYCGQELLEGALLVSHPAGLVSGVLADGGWTAAPLSALIGLLAALLFKDLEEAIERAAARARRARRRPARACLHSALPAGLPAIRCESAGIARGGAERAPPRRLLTQLA